MPHFSELEIPESCRSHSVALDPDHADESVPVGHSHVIRTRHSVRDFLTVLALSCHAIFEGLAIGLEKESEAVWTLFAGDKLCPQKSKLLSLCHAASQLLNKLARTLFTFIPDQI